MRVLIVAVLLSVGIAVSGARSATAALAGPDTLEGRLLSIVTHPARHGLPYDIAMSFGPDAVPILTKWLADTTFTSRYWGIFPLLGYLGGPKETALVEEFILHRYARNLDDTELTGLLAAMLALGCLSDRDSTALNFLEAATDTAFYTQAQTRYGDPLRGREGLHMLLSKLAINAIGLSARPEAEAILRRIEARPPATSQVANVSDALEGHARLMRLGRKAFIEPAMRRPASK